MPPTDTTKGSQNIHHCYLLQSLSNPSKNYIGYTVNPFRRLKQHNGIIKGGANYTSKFRPWKFIAITEGFESGQKGLQFEWAWQHPRRSKIFRNGLGGGMALAGMLEKQPGYIGRLRLLMILLCESKEFKNESLHVYFFEEEKPIEFNRLFNNRDDDDEDEEDWCKELPAQMGTSLVDNVEQMPFYRSILSKRKRKKKGHTSEGDSSDESNNDNDIEHDYEHEYQKENDFPRNDNLINLSEDDDDNSNFDIDGDIMIPEIEDVCNIRTLSISGGCMGGMDELESNDDASDVIHLCDSSDDDNDNVLQRRHSEANTNQVIAMDFNDSNSTIDLTAMATTPNRCKTSVLDQIQQSSRQFSDQDSYSSHGTIDLCSPDRSHNTIKI